MPKPIEPESFEAQGTRYEQAEDRISLIHQVVKDKEREQPSVGVVASTQGNYLYLKYHCYETFLGDRARLDALIKEAEKHMKEFVKYLKAEYKKRSGKTLSLSEDKEKRDYSVQKVSLNERYYFVYVQAFTLPE